MSSNQTVDFNRFQGSGAHNVPGQEGRQIVVSSNCPVNLNMLQGFFPSVSTQETLSSNPNRAVWQWNYQENPHTSMNKSPPGAYNTPFGAGHPAEACNSPPPVPILHFPQTSNITSTIDLQGCQMEQTCRSSDSNVFQSFRSSAFTQAMPPNDPNPHEGRRMDRGCVVNPTIGSNAFHGFPLPTFTQATSSNNPSPFVSQTNCHPDAPASAALPYANNVPSTSADPTPRDPITYAQCGWRNKDGVICGLAIDYDCRLHFSAVHGIVNLSADTIVSCRWCEPDNGMRRGCILRHIREAHLGFPRSKRRRAGRRPA